MSNQQHTPGPWTVENGAQVWYDGATAAASPRICTVQNAANPVRQLSEAEMMANARLIASAPDLLAALERLVSIAVSTGSTRDDVRRVALESQLAIAKAKGH